MPDVQTVGIEQIGGTRVDIAMITSSVRL